jgi:hypothetical protein
MEQFAAGMMLLWWIKAAAEASPFAGLVLLVVAVCTNPTLAPYIWSPGSQEEAGYSEY